MMANINLDSSSNTKRKHVVALGSSFAAGPGIQPQAMKAAGRSERNYAHLLATRLDAKLTDLTVSGATLRNVLSEPQVYFGHQFEPQVASLPSDVDIVTITGGGNDLDYISGIIRAELKSTYLGRFISWLSPTSSITEPLSVEDLAGLLIAIIDKIRETSPRCQIYLVEYLSLLGPQTRPNIDVSLDMSQIEKFRAVATKLQAAYKLAAEERGECIVIKVGDNSQDHALGSEEPWVEGFSVGVLLTRKAPFHPNARGMEAVASMIY